MVGIQNGLLRTKSPIGVEPASIGTAESDLAKLMEGTGGAALVVVSSANGTGVITACSCMWSIL